MLFCECGKPKAKPFEQCNDCKTKDNMTTKQAAQYLGIYAYYLRNMRHLMHAHNGPRYTEGLHPRGKACYYKKEDLDAWAKEHKWRRGRVENKAA
jgi:hypothetical protein